MTETIRQRKDYESSERKPRLYPELPEPLTIGTYDNHTHL